MLIGVINYLILLSYCCFWIDFTHSLLLKTPNLYWFRSTTIVTFFNRKPSAFTDDILSRETSNTNSPIFFERTTILPSVFSKMRRWLVKVSIPFFNLSSAQSSCRILFSPLLGSIALILLSLNLMIYYYCNRERS